MSVNLDGLEKDAAGRWSRTAGIPRDANGGFCLAMTTYWLGNLLTVQGNGPQERVAYVKKKIAANKVSNLQNQYRAGLAQAEPKLINEYQLSVLGENVPLMAGPPAKVLKENSENAAFARKRLIRSGVVLGPLAFRKAPATRQLGADKLNDYFRFELSEELKSVSPGAWILFSEGCLLQRNKATPGEWGHAAGLFVGQTNSQFFEPNLGEYTIRSNEMLNFLSYYMTVMSMLDGWGIFEELRLIGLSKQAGATSSLCCAIL